MTWKLHENAYGEWREQAADDYVQAQRRAFLDGFETAAKESEEFRLLREWLQEKRDKSERQYDDTDRKEYFARRLAFTEVLVKLSEIGVRSDAQEYVRGELGL